MVFKCQEDSFLKEVSKVIQYFKLFSVHNRNKKTDGILFYYNVRYDIRILRNFHIIVVRKTAI